MIVTLPESTTYDSDLEHFAAVLKIRNFRHVRMRDELDGTPFTQECGIINLNTHTQSGSHWTCYYKHQDRRFYFDSFGQPPPTELLTYLKSARELEENSGVIHRSAVMVQHLNTDECGSLCLYVLKKLDEGEPFSEILTFLLTRFRSFPTPALSIKV